MTSVAPFGVRRRRCTENDALVLAILEESNGPISAYAIAHRAASEGHRIVPNQVYRTLARLIRDRTASRIEALNAYVPRQSHANVCLICSNCHIVEFLDMPGLRRTIVGTAETNHFEVLSGLVEAQGECIDCRSVSQGRG